MNPKNNKKSKDAPRLTSARKGYKESLSDMLTRLTESVGFLDKLYHSPEESFDENIRGSFRVKTPEGDKWVHPEGIKELWKQSGKPFISTHNYPGFERAGFFQPGEADWHRDKKTLSNLVNKLFLQDQVFIPEGLGGASLAVSELAHALRFKDPKKYSKYETRKDLLMGKGSEHDEGFDSSLYGKPGTDEYQTHSVVEPIIRQWLIDNYSTKEAW